MTESKGLIAKLAPYSIWILVGGVVFVHGALKVGGMIMNRSAAPVAQSSGPSNTAQAVLENQAAIQDELSTLRQQVQNNAPSALQAITTQQVIGAVDARFDSFDDHAYSLWESMVREQASVIYIAAHTESQATGKRIELLLSQRLNYLKDRSYAVAQKHSGRVDQSNQEMVDTVAGQLLEMQAIAHVINQLANGAMPAPDTAEIGQTHMKVEGLSIALFEMQAQNIALTDATPQQPIAPSTVSEEVPINELANYGE